MRGHFETLLDCGLILKPQREKGGCREEADEEYAWDWERAGQIRGGMRSRDKWCRYSSLRLYSCIHVSLWSSTHTLCSWMHITLCDGLSTLCLLKRICFQAEQWGCTPWILALRRQDWISEFETSWVYRVSCNTECQGYPEKPCLKMPVPQR